MNPAAASLPAASAPPFPEETSTEAELVQAARTDPRAFGALYERHQRAIWRYLRHRTGESHAADDLSAEVFLEFLRVLPGFRARGIGVRGWLYRVATRRVARWAKRRRADESFDELLHTRAPRAASGQSAAHEPRAADAPHPNPSDDAARVRVALDGLHERWQTVLVLHHLEGLAVDEIAAALGVRQGTIKSRLARGRDELRRRLERRGVAR